jgi:hypothetical protein
MKSLCTLFLLFGVLIYLFPVGDHAAGGVSSPTLIVAPEELPPVHTAITVSMVFFERGPDVLRDLLRLLTVAAQLWRS